MRKQYFLSTTLPSATFSMKEELPSFICTGWVLKEGAAVHKLASMFDETISTISSPKYAPPPPTFFVHNTLRQKWEGCVCSNIVSSVCPCYSRGQKLQQLQQLLWKTAALLNMYYRKPATPVVTLSCQWWQGKTPCKLIWVAKTWPHVVWFVPSLPLTIHQRCVQGSPPPPYLGGYTPSRSSHAGRVLLGLIPLHQVAWREASVTWTLTDSEREGCQ